MRFVTISLLLFAAATAGMAQQGATDPTTVPATPPPAESSPPVPADPPATLPTQPASVPVTPPAGPQRVTLPSGLVIIESEDADAAESARAGDLVYLHYTGKLEDGTVFDTSLKPRLNEKEAHPLSFILGTGQVLKGWDEGVIGMKIGQKRQLIVPAALGYGAKGNPPTVPANANLVFDIELVGLVRGQ